MTWSIGRIPERHQPDAEAILGDAEDLLCERLIVEGRMRAPDPQVGRRQHHLHRRLPHVVEDPVAGVLIAREGRHEDDRRGRAADVPSEAPRLRQLPERFTIGADDEIPRLLVHRRGGPPGRLEDPLELFRGDRSLLVRADVATGSDRVPGLHPADVTPA